MKPISLNIFFCTSFNTKSLDKISQFLLSYYAFVYDSNIPTAFSTPTSFSNLVNGQYTTSTSSILYTTLGGVNFIGFGKNGMTGSDLYEDYVAPGISNGLVVETWCGGDFSDSPGCQPSNCQGQPIVNPSVPQSGQSSYAYDSVTIEAFDFGDGNSFDTSLNHAKFALSETGAWVCPGDINRQTTQRKRGGGAICFKNSGLYTLLDGAITALNKTC